MFSRFHHLIYRGDIGGDIGGYNANDFDGDNGSEFCGDIEGDTRVVYAPEVITSHHVPER